VNERAAAGPTQERPSRQQVECQYELTWDIVGEQFDASILEPHARVEQNDALGAVQESAAHQRFKGGIRGGAFG
jgi:hypothetical protein